MIPNKPQSRDGYSENLTLLVQKLCLYVATCLGDINEQVRIVGGLVPTLLIPQDYESALDEVHAGTQDLDLGFQVSILDHSAYQKISNRLKSAGFRHHRNSDGRPTGQRWIHPKDEITIDFLIPPNKINSRGGALQHLERNFAALITPGLELAFIDFEKVCVSGPTTFDEMARRDVYVCGPAAFLILKALALRNRGENKDAYDLHFVLRHWRKGLDDVVQRMSFLMEHSIVSEALGYLAQDFLTLDSIGPKRLDRFMGGDEADDEPLRADASALVTEFIRGVSERRK